MWGKAMIFNVMMQATVFIPLCIALVYRIKPNKFYSLLILSLVVSLIFDIGGVILAEFYGYNMDWYCTYLILSPVIFTLMWSATPSFSSVMKKASLTVGFGVTAMNVWIGAYYGFDYDAMYLMSLLATTLTLIYALMYYLSKLMNSDYSPPLKDPYFIVASAFLLFSLATITILAMNVIFEKDARLKNTWILRQVFYFMYNIIIAAALVAFYNKEVIFSKR